MILALAAILAAAIALPHVVCLRDAAPVTAITLWLSSLALRALAGALAVIYLLFFLPRTELFDALVHWCLHVAVPVEVHVEGHALVDIALYVPGIAVVVSLVVTCVATLQAANAARQLLDENALGIGPRNSVIVGGSAVSFAVAGVVRARIVVSAGALTTLDDDELAAALDHEQAHIAHRHRFVMLSAIAFRAIGRVVPGSRRAVHELAFHLERDADRWTMRRRNDRLALVSVICKAATADAERLPVLTGLGDRGVHERVRQLLDERSTRSTRPARAALNALAAAMAACTLSLGAAVPAAAVAGLSSDAHRDHHYSHCDR
jgi:bla regulator protein blaR1